MTRDLGRRRWLLGSAAAGLALACDRPSAPEPTSAASQRTSESTPGPTPAPEARARVRVLTYNILADAVAVERRIPALLRTMQAADADVLALQEVAPWFLDWVESTPWLRDYAIATIDGQIARPNGQMILSRLPILDSRARQLPGRQGRTALISSVELGAGERLCVATTHMESFLEDGPVRARQLDAIFEALARERDDPEVRATVFCGDLNFGDAEQPDTDHLDPAFVDLWTRLKPGEPGYTWDIEHSEMAEVGSFVGEPSRRLDRILLRSQEWAPAAIEIIGDRPVQPGDRRLFPSDHFGLVGELARA